MARLIKEASAAVLAASAGLALCIVWYSYALGSVQQSFIT